MMASHVSSFTLLIVAVAFAASFCVSSIQAISVPVKIQESNTAKSDFDLLAHVRTFEIVTPKLVKSFQTQSNEEAPKKYADRSEYDIQAFGKSFQLSLQKNTKLFANRYVDIQVFGENNIVETKPNLDEINCYYFGHDQQSEGSHVTLSTCDGLRGLINSQGETYVIEPAAPHQQSLKQQLMGVDVDTAHVMYRLQDQNMEGLKCGSDNGHQHSLQSIVEDFVKNNQPASAPNPAANTNTTRGNSTANNNNNNNSTTRGNSTNNTTRGNSTNNSNSTAHGNSTHTRNNTTEEETIVDFMDDADNAAATGATLYVELLYVNDVARYRSLGASTQSRSAGLANLVTGYYARTQFDPNVQVVLVGQVTYTTVDPYSYTYVGSKVETLGLLSNFNRWHATAAGLPAHDVGQLISSLPFNNNIMGLAPVGSMCNTGSSGGIIMATYGDVTGGMTSAHEMGHNFGMQHDSQGNSCPSQGAVMFAAGCSRCNATAVFSPCSVNYFNSWYASSRTKSCLYNIPN